MNGAGYDDMKKGEEMDMGRYSALVALIIVMLLFPWGQAAKAADGPESWDGGKYRLVRGTLHVHSWISTRIGNRGGAGDRIDEAITSLNRQGLDFAGMTDYADAMNDNQWLVNRGACSGALVNDTRDMLIQPLPGFEWALGGPLSASGPDVFRVNIFGEDQLSCATHDNNNIYHDNYSNGEMVNIEHPLVNNLDYVMLGANFYGYNAYRNQNSFPNSTVNTTVDSLYSWMDNNSKDPYGLMMGQINGYGADDSTLRSRLIWLDKGQLRNRQGLQRRMRLMEVSTGDTSPGSIKDLRHFYNLALCNHWTVAPTQGLDNTGSLAGPNLRQRFVGLWVDDHDSRAGNPNEKAKRMLYALKDRRTFVSENPYITLKFSSSLCDANYNLIAGTQRKMGDDAFLSTGNGSSPGIRLTLTLAQEYGAPADENRYRVKNRNIKLVRIGDYNSGTVASNSTPIATAADVTRYFTTTTLFKAYGSSNFEQTSMPGIVDKVMGKNAAGTGEFTITQNPKAEPSIYDLRGGALTLTCDESLKPFESAAADARIICYYALVKFESGEYALSSPVWVAGKETF
jgi:hypothetical protein